MNALYDSAKFKLGRRVKELEAENARLKRELQEEVKEHRYTRWQYLGEGYYDESFEEYQERLTS